MKNSLLVSILKRDFFCQHLLQTFMSQAGVSGLITPVTLYFVSLSLHGCPYQNLITKSQSCQSQCSSISMNFIDLNDQFIIARQIACVPGTVAPLITRSEQMGTALFLLHTLVLMGYSLKEVHAPEWWMPRVLIHLQLNLVLLKVL